MLGSVGSGRCKYLQMLPLGMRNLTQALEPSMHVLSRQFKPVRLSPGKRLSAPETLTQAAAVSGVQQNARMEVDKDQLKGAVRKRKAYFLQNLE